MAVFRYFTQYLDGVDKGITLDSPFRISRESREPGLKDAHSQLYAALTAEFVHALAITSPAA